MAAGGDLVRRAGGPRVRAKKGAIEHLYTAPPAGSVVVCLDEMGPQPASSYPGRRVVKPAPPKAQRAKQEIDYGRRGKGYVFGAFRRPPARHSPPLTPPHHRELGRFPGRGRGLDRSRVERVYAVLDNLNVHSAPDVLLFAWPTRAGSSCSSPSTPPT